jgi:hypothetical protein
MPVQIPEQYRETIEQFLVAYWTRRRWEIEQTVLGVQIPHVQMEVLFNSALADQLAEIARAAAGEMEHSENGFTEGVLQEGIQDLMERLFAPPGLYSSYTIPVRFWEHSLGQMVARAFLWMRGDELITLKVAAEIRNVTIQAISQAVQDGRLRRYVDPDAPERQGRTLVSRQEVEEMN